MREKIKKFIKIIFGIENNITLKIDCSFFISAILFLTFSLIAKEQNNIQVYNTFLCISSSLFGFWLAFIPNYTSILDFFIELIRLLIFSYFLYLSFNFCFYLSAMYNGFLLILFSILSCIGILISTFYFISKFTNIFNWFKKIFNQVKEKLFNSVQPATSKAKALIENITAFLVSIAGLGIAIKAIIEPLINLFN